MQDAKFNEDAYSALALLFPPFYNIEFPVRMYFLHTYYVPIVLACHALLQGRLSLQDLSPSNFLSLETGREGHPSSHIRTIVVMPVCVR